MPITEYWKLASADLSTAENAWLQTTILRLYISLSPDGQTSSQLPADPSLLIFAMGAGWALSMTASPNASATLLISGVTGIAPTTLTWKWNGAYALMCFAAFSAAFVILAQ